MERGRGKSAPSVSKEEASGKGVGRPAVAIIIDDMGYDYALDVKFIRLPASLSFAFLPYGPNTRMLARLAASMKKDVLVHLPMEPRNKTVNPGAGVLTVNMSLDSLIETMEHDIRAVPGAVGVNNHMGSRFTADEQAMKYVLAILKQKGMFFIDSRTTKDTVAYQLALRMGVPTGQRAVFLDHKDREKAIVKQLEHLVNLAKKNGSAIGIGHPYENTYKVLYEMLPLMKKEVEVVPVHELVH